jgi:hypothetical protein
MFVLHCRGNDPGRGSGHKRLDEPSRLRLEHGAKIGNLRIQFGVVDVPHLADRLGWLVIGHIAANSTIVVSQVPLEREIRAIEL